MQPVPNRMNRPPAYAHSMKRPEGLRALAALVCLLGLLATAPSAFAQSNAGLGVATGVVQDSSAPSAVFQLRDGRGTATGARPETGTATTADDSQRGGGTLMALPLQYRPGEFERYVQRLNGGDGARRLNIELLEPVGDRNDNAGNSPLVPADYLLQPGDEIALTLWGSIDADLRLLVDRSGRISIPRVGTIMVSGVRYSDLPEIVSRRVAQLFKNFQLSVSLGQLRGIRVFVTGFVAKPGVVMATSLSTLSQALLRAGGPAASGSFRKDTRESTAALR